MFLVDSVGETIIGIDLLMCVEAKINDETSQLWAGKRADELRLSKNRPSMVCEVTSVSARKTPVLVSQTICGVVHETGV